MSARPSPWIATAVAAIGAYGIASPVRAGGAPPLAAIAAIDFHGAADAAEVDIDVGPDAKIAVGAVTPTRVELVVDNAELAQKLERTLDVSGFHGPVKNVSSFHDAKVPGRVHIVCDLTRPVSPTVERDKAMVHWKLAPAVPAAAVKQPALTPAAPATPTPTPTPTPAPAPPASPDDPPLPAIPPHSTLITPSTTAPAAPAGFGATSTPIAAQSVGQVPQQPGSRNRHIYHGAIMDLDFDNAPMHELLRIIADTGHVNIVVPDNIDPKVTVKLKRVPWDEALEVILASHQLWYRREGNLYRIAPRAELDKEDEAEAARREAALKAETPRPEIIRLNYASAEELKTKLADLLSSKGKLQVDSRTNTLIVDDVAGNRAEIARLAYELDTQTPEISIEARIVEADSTFSRSFGIQWGGSSSVGATGGNATGLTFPSSIGIAGGATDSTTNSNGVAGTPSDFAVNLPATVGTGEGGALGLSLGSVAGNLNINLRLSALEDTGTVRIISAPKITVLNNKEAKISQGVSIPISVVSAAGTNTQFVQADLSLTVTPYVSQRDCAIAMNLNITNNQPDFVDTGARGDPTILRKEARTSILVNDGETTVLGGIYTRNSGLSYNKVPFLGDIPVLGWLFKKRTETDNRTEILVFITPRITNKGSLPCKQ